MADDDTVVPIKPGMTLPSDAELPFLEELGKKLHAHVETHGAVPDVVVLAQFGRGEDGMNWSVGFFSPEPRGKIEVYGTALGLLHKKLADE